MAVDDKARLGTFRASCGSYICEYSENFVVIDIPAPVSEGAASPPPFPRFLLITSPTATMVVGWVGAYVGVCSMGRA